MYEAHFWKKIGMLAFMKKITILIKKRVHKKQKDVNIVLDSSCNLLCWYCVVKESINILQWSNLLIFRPRFYAQLISKDRVISGSVLGEWRVGPYQSNSNKSA